MKKIAFALQMMSLMLILPVYLFVELSRPTTGLRGTTRANKMEQTNAGIAPTAVNQLPANPALLTTGR